MKKERRGQSGVSEYGRMKIQCFCPRCRAREAQSVGVSDERVGRGGGENPALMGILLKSRQLCCSIYRFLRVDSVRDSAASFFFVESLHPRAVWRTARVHVCMIMPLFRPFPLV